jgi:hypothetical protein
MNTPILVILFLLTLVIGASLFCGCCQYPIFVTLGNLLKPGSGMKEGMDGAAGAPGSKDSVITATNDISNINNIMNGIPSVIKSASESNPDSKQKNGFAPREGFITEGASTLGASLDEKNNGDLASSWISKATTFASEFGYGDINNTGTAYTGTPVPLPEGELVIFAQNKFKPECCPSPYSSSTGCACITPEQINYLNTRGGNRTSDSGV